MVKPRVYRKCYFLELNEFPQNYLPLILRNCIFTTPQSNQECFCTELSVQSLMFPVISTLWLDTETKPGPPLLLLKIFLCLPPTAICTAAWNRNMF